MLKPTNTPDQQASGRSSPVESLAPATHNLPPRLPPRPVDDPYLTADRNLHRWPGESHYYNMSTWEQLVRRSDGAEGLIATQFYFYPVHQSLPADPTVPDGPRVNTFIPPWAHATTDTAADMLDLLRKWMQENGHNDLKLTVTTASPNAAFQVSHVQLQIQASRVVNPGVFVSARINPGLMAAQIGGSTATVDGQSKQFPAPIVAEVAKSLLLELETQAKAQA